MRNAVVAGLMLYCLCTQAQVKIDGRCVCLDTLTNTILATIPEAMFGHDVQLKVEKMQGWQQATVNGNIGDGSTLLFSAVDAQRQWEVTAVRDDGQEVSARLQFTFLPIVQLLGSFGNEYARGTFLYSNPDSARTDTLYARVKWRGGTTNADGKHKRNYKVNFDADQRFFGLRNDDKWMLDAGQPDVFRLRNRIAMDLWNKMARKPYYAEQEPKALNGVRGDVVELFLGNEWRGVYNLSEFMDRKQMKLKKVDAQTGDIRGCLYKGVSWNKTQMFDFFSSYDNTKDTFFGYECKYPELGDDSDTVDWAPLITANNFARISTDEEFAAHVDDYFDLPVVMDYNIFFNVVNAVDNLGKNMYWACYDRTADKRMTLAPWDLDATFGQRWGGVLIKEIDEGFYHSPSFRRDCELMLTYRFFRDNFRDYLGQLNERYRELRLPGQPLHTDSILALVTRYYDAVKRSGAAGREEAKWSGDSDVWGDVISFDTEYAYICDWIRQRMTFMDQEGLPLFYTKAYFDALDISTQLSDTRLPAGDGVYDLHGRKVETAEPLKPGLYIKGRRKVAVW